MLTHASRAHGHVMVEMIIVLGVVTALLMDLLYLGASQAKPAEEGAGGRYTRPAPRGAAAGRVGPRAESDRGVPARLALPIASH